MQLSLWSQIYNRSIVLHIMEIAMFLILKLFISIIVFLSILFNSYAYEFSAETSKIQKKLKFLKAAIKK